jgi:uncharacterized membrane protein
MEFSPKKEFCMAQRHQYGIQSSVHVMGHPIHPMIVPLPMASFIALPLSDFAWLLTGNPFWAEASWWLLAAGLFSGILAGVVGAIDYLAIGQVRRLRAGKVHAYGNVLALLLAGMNLGIRWPDVQIIGGSPFLLSIVTVAILGVTAWFGGELTFRHRIGVAAPDLKP